MNIFALLFIFVVAIAAIIGLAYAGNLAHTNVIDSYNQTQGNVSNQSENMTVNLTATGTKVGSGAIFFVAGIIGVAVLGGFMVLFSSRRRGGSGRGM